MKVLVTGSAGYVGSVLCPIFEQHGHEVVGLDTGYYDGCDFGAYDGERKRLHVDVRDVDDARLTAAVVRLRSRIAEVAEARHVTIVADEGAATAPMACDPRLVEIVETAAG